MATETPSDEGTCPKVTLCLECCPGEVQHWKSSATPFHPAPQFPPERLCSPGKGRGPAGVDHCPANTVFPSSMH